MAPFQGLVESDYRRLVGGVSEGDRSGTLSRRRQSRLPQLVCGQVLRWGASACLPHTTAPSRWDEGTGRTCPAWSVEDPTESWRLFSRAASSANQHKQQQDHADQDDFQGTLPQRAILGPGLTAYCILPRAANPSPLWWRLPVAEATCPRG